MIITLGILAAIAIFIWFTYNQLVTAKQRVEESWAGIDVQLQRRANLIPNLVETVRGYADHEREVFQNVTKARSALMSAEGPRQKAEADNMLSGALKSLFAVAENYPNLRASENFQQLQGELSDTEDKIAYARQFYNQNVLDYNVKIKVFPTVLIADTFGFEEREFFRTNEESDREPVKVDFSAEE